MPSHKWTSTSHTAFASCHLDPHTSPIEFSAAKLCGLASLDSGLLAIIGTTDSGSPAREEAADDKKTTASAPVFAPRTRTYTLSLLWKAIEQRRGTPNVVGVHATQRGGKASLASVKQVSGGGGGGSVKQVSGGGLAQHQQDFFVREQQALRSDVTELKETVSGLQQVMAEILGEVRKLSRVGTAGSVWKEPPSPR